MTKTVDFIFDFASPNVYLAHKVLKDVAARTGADITIIPCLLGGMFRDTNNTPPMVALKDIKGKLNYERLEFMRFIKKHAIDKFTFNPHFPVNTVTLIRGALVAQDEGYLDAYIDAGMAAMWEDGLNMSDPEIFVATMDAAGLDGAHILARTKDDDIKQKLIANTAAAIQRGAFGMPTFYVGSEMFFGKERLGQVEEELSR